MDITNALNEPVYGRLRTKGVCSVCSYRFLQDSELNSIREIRCRDRSHFNKSDDVKRRKNNACVVCHDILDVNVIELTVKRITASGVMDFDCDTFMLALTLPSICQLREHELCVYLKSQFSHIYSDHFSLPRITFKEAWKFLIASNLSPIISKTYNVKSPLEIRVVFISEDDKKKEFSMKNFGTMNDADLKEDIVMIPSVRIRCESVSIRRDSLFIAGRYNKFSRTLSQTPWILSDGERKMNTSVEEIITTNLRKLTKAQDMRFSSSGREDVDVRMLGNGRPFAVELINAKCCNVSFINLRLVEGEINNVDSKAVLVRDLQIVDRNEMQFLKNGEEHKTKDYCAICLVRNWKCRKDFLQKLPRVPFHIQQKTPLRVLHRRTVAVRQKTIHKLSVALLNTKYIADGDDCTLIKLNVTTQAGTYVKEFIHGDFGRTFPNISQIFGQIPIDVLALDVTNVEVDWPTSLNYEGNIS